MQKENSNSCRAFENEVWLYISGEMSADRKKMWDGHIELCGVCSELLRSNREIEEIYVSNSETDMLDSSFERILAAATKKEPVSKKLTGTIKEFGSKFTFGKIVFGTTVAAASLIALLVTYHPAPEVKKPAEAIKWDDTEVTSKISEISKAINKLDGSSKLSDAEWSKSIKGIESRIDSLKFCINN